MIKDKLIGLLFNNAFVLSGISGVINNALAIKKYCLSIERVTIFDSKYVPDDELWVYAPDVHITGWGLILSSSHLPTLYVKTDGSAKTIIITKTTVIKKYNSII